MTLMGFTLKGCLHTLCFELMESVSAGKYTEIQPNENEGLRFDLEPIGR